MDRQTVALLIPIVAMTIPIVAIIMSTMHKMAKLRVEEARARHGIGEDSQAELDELRGEVDQLRIEVGDLNERLDFAERLLAKPQQPRDP